MEFKLAVSADYHLGGDGMAIWILDKKNNECPSGDNCLQGEVYGLRSDFKGCGVVLDTYDNDGQRDNPQVFVICHDGTQKDWREAHDNDFQKEYKRHIDIMDIATSFKYPSECTFDYRNSEHPINLIIRY